MLLYAAVEYKFLKGSVNNFLFAKAVSIFIPPIVIVAVFYTYTSILGYEILAVDILSGKGDFKKSSSCIKARSPSLEEN